MSLVTIVLLVLLVLLIFGGIGYAPMRAWGGGYGVPSVGAILLVILLLYVLGFIR